MAKWEVLGKGPSTQVTTELDRVTGTNYRSLKPHWTHSLITRVVPEEDNADHSQVSKRMSRQPSPIPHPNLAMGLASCIPGESGLSEDWQWGTSKNLGLCLGGLEQVFSWFHLYRQEQLSQKHLSNETWPFISFFFHPNT